MPAIWELVRRSEDANWRYRKSASENGEKRNREKKKERSGRVASLEIKSVASPGGWERTTIR